MPWITIRRTGGTSRSRAIREQRNISKWCWWLRKCVFMLILLFLLSFLYFFISLVCVECVCVLDVVVVWWTQKNRHCSGGGIVSGKTMRRWTKYELIKLYLCGGGGVAGGVIKEGSHDSTLIHSDILAKQLLVSTSKQLVAAMSSLLEL